MDQSTACTIIACAGGVYAAQTLLVPHTYLEADKTAVNADTEALTRGMGGGIAGLVRNPLRQCCFARSAAFSPLHTRSFAIAFVLPAADISGIHGFQGRRL